MSATVQGKRRHLAVPRGGADFRNPGGTHGRSRRRTAGYPVLGRGSCVAAERNDPDVLADERFPFATLAEADFEPTKAAAAGRNPAAFKLPEPIMLFATAPALASRP